MNKLISYSKVAAKHAAGVASYIPGLYKLLKSSEVSGVAGSTSSARYCYNVFWRHVESAEKEAGVSVMRSGGGVVELGPGGSLGTGLCALMCGFDRYTGIDVVPFAKNVARNLAVFDELVALFASEMSLDVTDSIWPAAQDVNYPRDRIQKMKAAGLLAPERLANIRQVIATGETQGDIALTYCHPGQLWKNLEEGSIDWVFSQAVLEHVMDIAAVHVDVARLLRKGGHASHTIDFKSHGSSIYYNGHYGYGESMWKFLNGRRVLLSNRKPPSAHLKAAGDAGMQVLVNKIRRASNPMKKSRFHQSFRGMTDIDAYASSSFLVAIK